MQCPVICGSPPLAICEKGEGKPSHTDSFLCDTIGRACFCFKIDISRNVSFPPSAVVHSLLPASSLPPSGPHLLPACHSREHRGLVAHSHTKLAQKAQARKGRVLRSVPVEHTHLPPTSSGFGWAPQNVQPPCCSATVAVAMSRLPGCHEPHMRSLPLEQPSACQPLPLNRPWLHAHLSQGTLRQRAWGIYILMYLKMCV